MDTTTVVCNFILFVFAVGNGLHAMKTCMRPDSSRIQKVAYGSIMLFSALTIGLIALSWWIV